MSVEVETTKIDPNEFDVTINALLIGLDAEKYIPIFKKRNIGQSTLAELTEDDLQKLGVDDAEVRTKLLGAAKALPICEEASYQEIKPNLAPLEIVDILEESSQHLYRIYLSLMANTLAMKKSNKISDCLLYQDKYASNIALSTLTEITNIINSMDIAIHTQLKPVSRASKTTKKKKILVGTVGSAVIAILAVLFTRSLKELKTA